jgi:hypothetical protein
MAGRPAAEGAVDVACPFHPSLFPAFAGIGERSPSRRFAGEVVDRGAGGLYAAWP